MAPFSANDLRLAERIAGLRAEGRIVVELLPGELRSEGPLCDTQLVEDNGQWVVQAINRE